MYSNCCCSCSFELEIIKIGHPFHKTYSNKILNFQESTTILNACTKKSGNLLNTPCTCPKIGCGISVHRIYEGFQLNLWEYLIIYAFQDVYKKTNIYIYSVYNVTQPRLKFHYKFISTKNIIFTHLMTIHRMRSAFHRARSLCADTFFSF